MSYQHDDFDDWKPRTRDAAIGRLNDGVDYLASRLWKGGGGRGHYQSSLHRVKFSGAHASESHLDCHGPDKAEGTEATSLVAVGAIRHGHRAVRSDHHELPDQARCR